MSQANKIAKKLDSIDNMIPEDPRFHKIYGAHVYWAKKPANIVSYCIDNLSSPGDVILDPFAGVGVVPIEAMRLGRKGIGTDLCPLAVFIMEKSAMPCNE
jgi:adenine-specific DNA methylase